MKILIIDDHPLTCKGLAALLLSANKQAEILSVHTAASAKEKLAELSDDDWIFLDIKLPDDAGYQLFHQLCSTPWIKRTILISAEVETQLINTALAAGARGFLSKTAEAQGVLEGFEKIKAGEIFLPPELLEKMGRSPLNLDAVRRLSPRLLQVQDLLLRGASNKLIARDLELATNTVKEYVSAVLAFNGVASRLELVLKYGALRGLGK